MFLSFSYLLFIFSLWASISLTSCAFLAFNASSLSIFFCSKFTGFLCTSCLSSASSIMASFSSISSILPPDTGDRLYGSVWASIFSYYLGPVFLALCGLYILTAPMADIWLFWRFLDCCWMLFEILFEWVTVKSFMSARSFDSWGLNY